MRTLTSKEYEVISKIYNSTDEIESNLSFEFGIQSDFYYQLFHSYSETKDTEEVDEFIGLASDALNVLKEVSK